MATKFRFKNADGTTVDFEDYYVRADYFRSGNLWLWGSNGLGGLGDNTTISRSSPVQTIAWGSNWKETSFGLGHAAGIKTDGTLWVWGSNLQFSPTVYGQLGDNTGVSKSSPVQTVAFGTNWKQVNCGYYHTAAIKTDGTLWCWGGNTKGQLGDNTVTNRSSPVQTIARGTNWKQVSCGYEHTAAIKTDGTLWSWGSGSILGDNTSVNKSSPVQTITYGNNWSQIKCSKYNSFAIKTDGTLWGWGADNNGELGDNNNTSAGRSSPVQTVTAGNNWKYISALSSYTAAIKTDGTLWMWGTNNNGQLGDNTITNRSSPVQTIVLGNNWKQVSCGGGHLAAVKTDGTLWTWGLNVFGALGDNTTIKRSSPVQTIAFGTNWKQVYSGQYTTAAIQYQDDYQ